MATSDLPVRWSSYFQLPNPSLKGYFGRVVSGFDQVIKTNFGGKATPQANILGAWSKEIETIKSSFPSLYEYEKDQQSKVGPMSVMKPLKDRMADIDHYYADISLPQRPIDDRAIDATLSDWVRVRGLEPRSQDRTIANMKLSTNSGSPFFTRKRLVVEDTVPFTLSKQGTEVVSHLPKSAWLNAAVLGWRGQEGGPDIDNIKQRVVWMFPFAVNVSELSVYQPLIQSAQKYDIVPAWISNDVVDSHITKLFDTKDRRDLVICTDFSKFDQHFNPVMQQCAYNLLSNLLNQSSASKDWLDVTFPIKYQIPLAYDWGAIRTGAHGMGSGSGGTNCDETLAHKALQHEAAILQGQKLNPHSLCLGDDGVLSFPGISIDSVVKAYSSHGQDVNPIKQTESTDWCVYLRRWHHVDYRDHGIMVGVYPTMRALGRLMYQERFYEGWSAKMVALRQLSIIENVKWHPLREEFAEFCMKRDKYRLGLDIPGFLDDITSIAKEAIAVMPDFLGYTRSLDSENDMSSGYGIADWWIVSYLKSHV